MSNQNLTQITNVQTGSADPTSLLYAVVGSTLDSALPLSVLFNAPTFTGAPKVPTPVATDNSTTIASTQYVQTNLVNYLTTISASNTYATISNLNLKAPSASPTFTGTVTATGATLVGFPGRLLKVTTFTTSGTYTPTAGVSTIIIEGIGGGGGSGGNPATSATQNSISGAGNAGAYGRAITTTVTSQTVTVGAAGAAGTAGANAGGNGGNSSFGTLAVFGGGNGGSAGVASVAPIYTYPTANTTAVCSGTATLLVPGTGALCDHGNIPVLNSGWAATGASSVWGSGGRGGLGGAQAGTGFGAGAGGAYQSFSASAQAGAAGSPGLLIIYEYA